MKLSLALSAAGVLLAAGCSSGGSSTDAASSASSAPDSASPSTVASPDAAQACLDLRDALLAMKNLSGPGGEAIPAKIIAGMADAAAKFTAAARTGEPGSPFQVSAQAAAEAATKEAASLKANGPTDGDHALLVTVGTNSKAAAQQCAAAAAAASASPSASDAPSDSPSPAAS